MRAITVDSVSSEPYCLHRAALIIQRFSKTSVSHLPSSDCHAYIHTVHGAMQQLHHELVGTYHQRAADLDAHDYEEDPVEGDRRHQDQESEGDMAVDADGSHRYSAAEADPDVASGKKGNNNKKKNGNPPLEDIEVARADSHIPPSPEIATEKKRKKKKHPNQEIVVYVKQEPVEEEVPPSPEIATEKKRKKKKHPNQEIVVYVKQEPVEEEVVSEKRKSKKKKEKGHVKLEEGVNEVQEKMVNGSAAEQRVFRTERESKKKKHEQEEGGTEVVKEEKMTADGDLDIEKKRKKKRVRGDDNALEPVEHTKKKQKKHSGD